MLVPLTSNLGIKHVPNTQNICKTLFIIYSNKLPIFILLIKADVGVFTECWRFLRICSDENKHKKMEINIVYCRNMPPWSALKINC